MTNTDTNAPRRTRQRAAVSAIMDTLNEFRTAQEIHNQLRIDGQTIGLATVYRTLTTMADAGEIDCIRTPDGQSAYRTCPQSRGHHHHLICRDCGRAVEINLPSLEKWAQQVADDLGFTDIDHELELYGRCADCSKALGSSYPVGSERSK